MLACCYCNKTYELKHSKKLTLIKNYKLNRYKAIIMKII